MAGTNSDGLCFQKTHMSPIGNYCLASIAILFIWHSIFCTICGENEGYLQIFMWVLRLMNEFVMDFFF